MPRKVASLGTVVIVAREGNAPWVKSVRGEVRARGLRPHIVEPEMFGPEIGKHAGLTCPTRFVIHAREMDRGLTRLLESRSVEIGGKVIFVADPAWTEKLARTCKDIARVLDAFPHAPRCIGQSQFIEEIDRITQPRSGW